jgi:hypothetical protein
VGASLLALLRDLGELRLALKRSSGALLGARR